MSHLSASIVTHLTSTESTHFDLFGHVLYEIEGRKPWLRNALESKPFLPNFPQLKSRHWLGMVLLRNPQRLGCYFYHSWDREGEKLAFCHCTSHHFEQFGHMFTLQGSPLCTYMFPAPPLPLWSLYSLLRAIFSCPWQPHSTGRSHWLWIAVTVLNTQLVAKSTVIYLLWLRQRVSSPHYFLVG